MREQTYQFLRSFPKGSPDLADIPETVETLSIGRDTRNVELLTVLPHLRRLWAGGATAGVLELIGRVQPLEELVVAAAATAVLPEWEFPRLRTLVLTGCSRLTSVEGLATLSQLETLAILDAKRLTDYRPLRCLSRLRVLELGTASSAHRQVIETLGFLSDLREVEQLTLHFSAVGDHSLRPIADLPQLRTLSLSNTFPREVFADLAARLPGVKCEWFAGYARLGTCRKCGGDTAVMLTGRRQGPLCTSCNRQRLEEKTQEFNTLVESARLGRQVV